MPNTEVFGAEDSTEVIDIGQESIENLVESPADISHSALLEAEARYTAGLESIKSYLRDLYDLSRTPIEPYGGFEVVGSGAEGGLSTPFVHSRSESPIPVLSRSAAQETRRARRPTLESGLSRNASTASASDKGSERAMSNIQVDTSGKRFKDDKVKRARVIREIYE